MGWPSLRSAKRVVGPNVCECVCARRCVSARRSVARSVARSVGRLVRRMVVSFAQVVNTEFDAHCTALRQASRDRRAAVQLRAAVDDNTSGVAVDIRDTLGVRQPQDKWEGCINLRTLRTLLSIVDDRGFERYALLFVSPTLLPSLTHRLATLLGGHARFPTVIVPELTLSVVVRKPDPLTRWPSTRRSSGACRASSTRRTGRRAGRRS